MATSMEPKLAQFISETKTLQTKVSLALPTCCWTLVTSMHIALIYVAIYPIRPCILGNSHGLKVIIHSDNPLIE